MLYPGNASCVFRCSSFNFNLHVQKASRPFENKYENCQLDFMALIKMITEKSNLALGNICSQVVFIIRKIKIEKHSEVRY